MAFRCMTTLQTFVVQTTKYIAYTSSKINSRNCTLCNFSIQQLRRNSSFTDINKPSEKKSTQAQNTPVCIYTGNLAPQIRAVKWFSLGSSVFGICVQPILYKEILALGSVPVAIAAYSFVGFFTLVTPILLHFITKKYVIQVDYKPESGIYVAKTYSLFCRVKEIEFTPDDVFVPDVPGMFTSILAKNNPLFIDPRLFTDANHYAKIMGYDKPIDFKLNNTVEKDKK